MPRRTLIPTPTSPADARTTARASQPPALRPWKSVTLRCIASLLLAVATTASAVPGTFEIEQIYSNASGTVQFVVIRDRGRNDCDSGEAFWTGETLRSFGSPGPNQTYVFPNNLPTCATSGKRILIATQGFAALRLVTPDFVIPNGFIPLPNGEVEFAGISVVQYTALPIDRVTAILADGTRVSNRATNLAGQSASITSLPSFAINFGIGGTWYNPATPGQGFLLEVVPALNSLAIGWFTWGNTAGDHFWLSGLGPISGDSATVTLQRSSNGVFNNPAPVAAAPAGTATFRFTDCSHATVTFQRTDTGESGTIPIERLTPVPSACSAAAAR